MGVGNGVEHVNFVQNGKSILVSGPYYLKLLDAEDGHIIKDYGLGDTRIFLSEDKNSFTVANDFTIYFYSISTGNKVVSIQVEKSREFIYEKGDTLKPYNKSFLYYPQIIPYSNYLFVYWEAVSRNPNINAYITLLIIDKTNGNIVKNFGLGNSPWRVPSPDGNYFVLAQDNGDVELWDAKTFTKIQTLYTYKIKTLVFSSDGSKLIIAGEGNGNILLFDIESRILLKAIDFDKGNEKAVCNSAAFINNNFILCGGGYEPPFIVECARIFNLNNKNMVRQFNYDVYAVDVYQYKAIISNYSSVVMINLDPNLLSVPKDMKTNNQLIFPNPTSNKATFKIPENISGNVTISIIDIYGKIISKSEEYSATVTKEIDVSALSAGIYFVRIGNQISKFIKI
jgi:WD40 repeat protein